MNLNLSERWSALRPVWRAIYWGVALLLILFASLAHMRAVNPAIERYRGPSMVHLGALRRQIKPLELPQAAPFSALDFRTQDAHLMSWQPDGDGGELRIRGTWHSLPALLSVLARSETTVSQFSIIPQAGALEIVFRLERTNDA